MNTFKSPLSPVILLLCLFTLTAGQNQQTPPTQQRQPQQPAAQQQTAPPPEAITEPVRAIKMPRAPLPKEEASAGVNQFSFIVYGDTRGRRDGFELQYEHSLIINSALGTIKKLEKTPFPVRFVIQTGDGVANGAIGRQWNASYVDLINRLTQEGNVPYFLAPGNHDLSSATTHGDPRRQAGLKNFFSANAELIPPEGSPRRLAGYPVFSFGYGNMFVIALDSNIAGDDKQYEWVKAQLEGLDRNRYRHVVVYYHHPILSSGPHGGPKVESQTAILRQRYMPMFRRHHVRMIFAGHDHTFEHWVERYIAKPAYEPGEGAYHYVLVQVDGDRISLEVVGVDWGRNFQPYRSNKSDLS